MSWASTAANYGTFTDTGNGTYRYVLNNTNPLVQGLDGNETLTETFSYTMRDADGDLDTATLTITITSTNDTPSLVVDQGNPPGANDQAFESGLAAGSAAASDGEFATGTFTLSDADGLDDIASVTITGLAASTVLIGSLVGSTFAGAHGTLTITAYNDTTGVASYTYELTSATTDLVDGIEQDTFTLSVSDGTVSSPDAVLAIDIVDDVSNAVNDTNTVAEDTIAPITGNVLTNDLHPNGQPGADTPTSFVSWASTAANYGTFTDTGNGTYSYVLDNTKPLVQGLDGNETLTETFSYTMRDADGDLDTATLTITITSTNDTPSLVVDQGNPPGANDQVFESGLAAGSAAASDGEFATGTFTLSDADGLDDIESVTITGLAASTVLIGSLVGSTFAGAHGTLTITAYNSTTGVASYTYELTSATTDLAGIEQDTFTLSVSDGTVSSPDAVLAIDIEDDRPEIFGIEGAVLPNTGGAFIGDDRRGLWRRWQ